MTADQLLQLWKECVNNNYIQPFMIKMDEFFHNSLNVNEQLYLLNEILFTDGNTKNVEEEYHFDYCPLVSNFMLEWSKKSDNNLHILIDANYVMMSSLDRLYQSNKLENKHYYWITNQWNCITNGICLTPYRRLYKDNKHNISDNAFYITMHFRSCFFKICHLFERLPDKYLNFIDTSEELTLLDLFRTMRAFHEIQTKPESLLFSLPKTKSFNSLLYNEKDMGSQSRKETLDEIYNYFGQIVTPRTPLYSVYALLDGQFVENDDVEDIEVSAALKKCREIIFKFLERYHNYVKPEEVMTRFHFMVVNWLRAFEQTMTYQEFAQQTRTEYKPEILEGWGTFKRETAVPDFHRLLCKYLPITLEKSEKTKNAVKNPQIIASNNNKPTENINKVEYPKITDLNENNKSTENQNNVKYPDLNQVINNKIEVQIIDDYQGPAPIPKPTTAKQISIEQLQELNTTVQAAEIEREKAAEQRKTTELLRLEQRRLLEELRQAELERNQAAKTLANLHWEKTQKEKGLSAVPLTRLREIAIRNTPALNPSHQTSNIQSTTTSSIKSSIT